jgi:hypothetical protein
MVFLFNKHSDVTVAPEHVNHWTNLMHRYKISELALV